MPSKTSFKASKKKLADQYRNRYYVYGRTVTVGKDKKMFWTSEPNIFHTEADAIRAAEQATEDAGVDYQVFMVETSRNYYYISE